MSHKHITNKNHWAMQHKQKKKEQIRDPALYPKVCGSIIWAFHIPVWWDIKREWKKKKTALWGRNVLLRRNRACRRWESDSVQRDAGQWSARSLASPPCRSVLNEPPCKARALRLSVSLQSRPAALSTPARSALFTSSKTAVNNTNEWINAQTNAFS